jgi:hypothetical protein
VVVIAAAVGVLALVGFGMASIRTMAAPEDEMTEDDRTDGKKDFAQSSASPASVEKPRDEAPDQVEPPAEPQNAPAPPPSPAAPLAPTPAQKPAPAAPRPRPVAAVPRPVATAPRPAPVVTPAPAPAPRTAIDPLEGRH